MMLLELEEPITASTPAFSIRDVPGHEPDPLEPPTSVTVQISRRGGGEIPPMHASVIAMAATVTLSRNPSVASHTTATPPEELGRWVRQGRALIHGSHNVTRRPVPPRMAPITAQSTSADKYRPKGVRSEAAD